MSCVLTELKAVLCSKRFWLAVVGMTVVSLLSLVNEMRMAPDTSVYYLYMVYFYYPMWMVVLVFPVIPGATSFCIDWNTHIYRMKVIRCGKKSFILSKPFISALSAFLVAALSQIWMLALLAIQRPAFLPGDGGALVGGIYESYLNSEQIWIYFFSKIFFQAMGAAFFSVLALWISVKIPDILVVVTVPMISYYIFENLLVWLRAPVFLSISRILRGNIEITRGVGYTWLYAGAFWGTGILLFSYLFFRGCKRRIENG